MRKIMMLAMAMLSMSGAAFAQGATQPVKSETVAATPAAASGEWKIEAKLCKSIANRECVDPTDTFKTTDGQAVAWIRAAGPASGGEIHAVWFMGDTQTDDITLKVGGSPWRTNSKKTLRDNTKGDWRVEIRDASGGVLETLKFKVE